MPVFVFLWRFAHFAYISQGLVPLLIRYFYMYVSPSTLNGVSWNATENGLRESANVPYRQWSCITNDSTIKGKSNQNIMFFAWKLRGSISVSVCMRFRIHRYVAALIKQPVFLLFTSLCGPGQDQSGTFCHFAFQTSIATAALPSQYWISHQENHSADNFYICIWFS
jgi:hypothetical protein